MRRLHSRFDPRFLGILALGGVGCIVSPAVATAGAQQAPAPVPAPRTAPPRNVDGARARDSARRARRVVPRARTQIERIDQRAFELGGPGSVVLRGTVRLSLSAGTSGRERLTARVGARADDLVLTDANGLAHRVGDGGGATDLGLADAPSEGSTWLTMTVEGVPDLRVRMLVLVSVDGAGGLAARVGEIRVLRIT